MRAFTPSGHQTREINIALPTRETDMYRIHQHVWRHVMQACGRGSQPPYFLYRVDGPFVRIRSDAFRRTGVVADFRSTRPVYVDLAALQGGGTKQPVPAHLLEDWCARQLATAGFLVRDLTVVGREVRTGFKPAGAHTITIPVARVEALVRVADQRTCDCTWRTGLGRGKRFGLGMLTH